MTSWGRISDRRLKVVRLEPVCAYAVEVVVPEKTDELGLLLSEKENADDRIGAYYQLQSSILGLALSAVVGVLGFVFTKEGLRTGTELTYILLALVGIASIAGLQATIFNGFALGYIYYKRE